MTVLRLFLVMMVAIPLMLSAPARATVVWEDYQGTQGILGTSNQDKPGPSYDNNSATSAINRNLLRTIAADINNATRTGTSPDINFTAVAGSLCNLTNSAGGAGYDPAGTGATCQADAQGRVVYALIKFPTAGSFTFAAAHDDEVDLDLSSDFGNINYRTASYNLPVGDAASFTANENTFENLAGVVSSPSANACILLRLYWNNAGGINHLRLRWTRPSGVIEIIPASVLFDPGLAASSSGCAGTVTSSGTSVILNKIVAVSGRARTSDQFQIAVTDTATGVILSSGTTSGSGTGQQASTGASLINTGVTYRLSDAMNAGSTSTLATYDATIACTRSGLSYTPGGSAPNWTVSATALNQQIVCSITNSRRAAMLRLQKTWVNAILNNAVTLPATSGFATNTVAFNSIANSANETDQGIAVSVLVGDNGTLPAEVFTTGMSANYASALGCSAGTLSGTDGQAANTIIVPEAAAGATLTCTYTNTFRPPLIVAKTSLAFSDPVNGTTNPKVIPGAFVAYTIAVSSPSAYTVTNNSISVVDTLPAQARLFVGDLGGLGSGPVALVNGAPSSTLTYTYSGLASISDDLEFSNDGGTTWAYIPTPDAGGVDATITHVRINPKGTMALSSNFSILLRCRVI